MNTEYMRTGKKDYFSFMGPPETPAPPPPTYVNTRDNDNASPDTSYLKMSPTTGKVAYDASNNEVDGRELNQIHLSNAMFKKSPPANNFDKRNERQSKKPEEMPMLKHINEMVSSDSEEGEAGGAGSDSPAPEKGIAMTQLNTDSRNYVNVPSSLGQKAVDVEKGYNSKDAFSNPTYLGLKSYSDKNKA